MKLREEALRQREAMVRTKEMGFDQRLEQEKQRFQLQEQQRYAERTHNVEVAEAKIGGNHREICQGGKFPSFANTNNRTNTH